MFMNHKESTLKTNNLTHAVNDTRKTFKLDGIWKDASKGDVKAIQKKIAKGESPHVETDEKKTPLHYAAEFGHINAADALLNAGARIDQRDNKGDTPVHVALKAKQEEMALFLAAKGADLYLTNSSSQSSFDLAARVSNRFIIKLREGSRCSNPAPIAAVVAKPKAIVETTTYYPLLNQIVITFGEYSMLVRSLPSLGAPSQPDRTPPFPISPFHALQLCIGKLKSLTEQIIIANNSGQFSPEFKGNTSNFRENVNNLNNLLRQPIADAITFNAIQDTSMITTKLTDMFVQYEQGVVGMIFKSHMEKFVMDIKKVSENPLFPDLVLDFINLYRNVLVQLMFIRDPEKSKHISDGLQQCCQLLKELIKAKTLGQPPQAYIRSIAENLTKINHSLLQVGHDSALFQEEELEIFESGSQMLRDVEKLEIGVQDKRVIEILQSEILYIKEAIANPPPEPELLLNCSLFISSTCSRISKYLPQQQQQQQQQQHAKKKWIDVGIGFLMQCHNELILIACALVNKNRQFHFVHIGYVIRAIACVVSILLDPEFYIE